jgi:hypothetical protein
MDIRQTGCETVFQDKSSECFWGDHDYETSGTTLTTNFLIRFKMSAAEGEQ